MHTVMARSRLHAVLDPQPPFLDLAQLVAVGVLELDGVADAQRFAVYLGGRVALVVLGPEVIADRNQLSPHLVALAATAARAQLAVSLTLVTPILPSPSSHGCSPLHDYDRSPR